MEKKYKLPEDHIFSYNELVTLLDKSLGRTLGDLDKNHVFDKTKNNPKITGIAGDVVEQSVLGYKPDSNQRPDILVDDKYYEVKTTGIRASKKKDCEYDYEAKEPMSITAVSPEKIVGETFETSHFWEKLKNMLLVYYLYDSIERVLAADYAKFLLEGYEFHSFDDSDICILKNDWETVRNFIREIQEDYSNPESQYPRISYELRDKLMYIDTAPKWPNPPRFRLKRSVVTGIVDEYFRGNKHLEELPVKYDSYNELDEKCREFTIKYKNKSVEELLNIFSIPTNDLDNLSKSVSEQIVVKMFEGNSKKFKDVKLFNEIGLNIKSIVLTSKGGRTEDTKLMRLDFDEYFDSEKAFEDYQIYDYFMNHQFLCIIFEEKDGKQKFKDNKFVGFKRFIFSDDFINSEVKKTWSEIRTLILRKELKNNICVDKNGNIIVNKTGVVKSAPNFPKSKTNAVFVRGDSSDSTSKTEEVLTIKMYRQYIWIKGKIIVDILKEKQLL
jgi:hypothetical protein